MECPTCHELNEDNAAVCKRCGVVLRSGKTPDNNQITQVKFAQPIQVEIIDIDMPFMSMVNFMAKLALAAIPAALVVAIIAVGVGALFAGIFRH